MADNIDKVERSLGGARKTAPCVKQATTSPDRSRRRRPRCWFLLSFCTFIIYHLRVCLFVRVFLEMDPVSRDLCCVRCECTNPGLEQRGSIDGETTAGFKSPREKQTNRWSQQAMNLKSKLIRSFSVTNIRWKRLGLPGAGRWGVAAATPAVSCRPAHPPLQAAPLA